MKKIYIQPTTQVLVVEQQTICAISDFNQEKGETAISGDQALSKERGDWDIWGDEE